MSDITTIARTLAYKAMAIYITVADPAMKSLAAFDRQLWRAALDLYRGGDEFAFIDDYTSAIENQLTRAWNQGARDVGVDPREFDDNDLAKLEGIIKNEHEFILNLAQAIIDARGKTLEEFRSEFRSRIDMWVNRYSQTENDARVWFGGRDKLKFVLGPTEEHCHTGDVPGKAGCADLNGIVMYAKEWLQTGIQPGQADSPTLSCGGWHCQCKLQPTNERRTLNGLQRVLDMLTGANL